MVFSSILFMFIYLPVVLAVYYLSPLRWRNVWLFAVNLVFYGWGEPVYLFLMMISITINYISGYQVGKYRVDNRGLAKRWLIVNTVINLGILFFFKYFDLIASSLSMIPGISVPTLGLTLPIGISFYTFQTMSYPIDVYRGDADVQKNYISFGTFVALFPQLIAGPIVRYKDVADQLNFRASNIDQFASGVQRFTVGLAKKVLLANNLGHLWDIYGSQGASLTTLGAWIGAVGFAMQLYFDFSGYSDMAIGLGRMLGFEFLENFNYPYISKTITEFWRRWHISLGTWFRDYVYIPLGGNRRGPARQLVNILIVWALTGLWHGANWTFMFWGLYFALFLILEKNFYGKFFQTGKRAALGILYTDFVVVCGWPLFQLDSLSACGNYYKALFGFAGGGLATSADFYYLSSFGLILIIGALACTPLGKWLYGKLPRMAKSIAAPALILLVLVFATSYLVDATYNPFLYFRF